jgi:DNA-binding NarL/FixJ family response regulator
MRVAIAEDSALFREGLTMLLAAVGVEVTIQAATGDELTAKVDRDPPDVAILDIRMPPTHTDEGLDTARQLRERHPDMGILLLSAYSEAGYAARLPALGGRRLGYLLKDRVTDVAALRDALDRIDAGENVIDPQVVTHLLGAHRRNRMLDALTERERAVLGLMAEGRSNNGIGAQLHLTSKTVEKHIAHIFTKLGLDSSDTATNPRVHAVLTWLRAADDPSWHQPSGRPDERRADENKKDGKK